MLYNDGNGANSLNGPLKPKPGGKIGCISVNFAKFWRRIRIGEHQQCIVMLKEGRDLAAIWLLYCMIISISKNIPYFYAISSLSIAFLIAPMYTKKREIPSIINFCVE